MNDRRISQTPSNVRHGMDKSRYDRAVAVIGHDPRPMNCRQPVDMGNSYIVDEDHYVALINGARAKGVNV